jgi:glycosyltransferase involved in cell wall biosynthesis
MRVTIVTPCRNAARYIKETVQSVLSQHAVETGQVTLEYIVCDGASTDETVKIVQGFNSPLITIISEPDKTMYEALAKGLSRATGDIVAYLNAGDYYHPYALDVVAELFMNREISWITGFATVYNELGAIVEVVLPFRYRRRLFVCGAYGTSLPFLEQESTFWRRSVQENLNYDALARMRYAGDYFLWESFSHRADLCVVEAVLGGFRKHSGQLSENLESYLEEVRQVTRKPSLVDSVVATWDRLLWNAPSRIKKRFNSKGLFRYDHVRQRWY